MLSLLAQSPASEVCRTTVPSTSSRFERLSDLLRLSARLVLDHIMTCQVGWTSFPSSQSLHFWYLHAISHQISTASTSDGMHRRDSQHIPLRPMRTQISLRRTPNLVLASAQIPAQIASSLALADITTTIKHRSPSHSADIDLTHLYPAGHPLASSSGTSTPLSGNAHHPILIKQQRIKHNAPASLALLQQKEESAIGFIVHFDT